MTSTVFACDMAALSPEERAQHARTTRMLFGAVSAVHEQTDGFAFELPSSAELLSSAAAFIILERRCCPFFGFAVDLAPGAASFQLRITGPGGVKPFIQAELGAALPTAIRAERATGIPPA